MAWRFRKTKSFGPFRATLGKKGIGTSVGFLGVRIGVDSQGKWYYSFGMPGTGFYYIKYFNKQN